MLFFILVSKLMGQKNDSLIIGDRLHDFYFQMLSSYNHSGIIIKPLTKEDSLYGSFFGVIYYTNKRDTFFQKELNYYLDKVVAEGKVVRFFFKERVNFFKRKKLHDYLKIGVWKKYDFINNEIQYLEYFIINRYTNPYKVLKTEKIKN